MQTEMIRIQTKQNKENQEKQRKQRKLNKQNKKAHARNVVCSSSGKERIFCFIVSCCCFLFDLTIKSFIFLASQKKVFLVSQKKKPFLFVCLLFWLHKNIYFRLAKQKNDARHRFCGGPGCCHTFDPREDMPSDNTEFCR